MSRNGKQTIVLPEQIIKRNGAYVAFDLNRVTIAVQKCYDSLPVEPLTPVSDITLTVANIISARYSDENPPTVEAVQDIVESALLGAGEHLAARHYIVYREEHAKSRVIVPAEVTDAFERDKHFFATPLQQFMFYDKYSRYSWEFGRRETWLETVARVVDYLTKLSNGALGHRVYSRISEYIRDMKVMPSMRLLAMAGPAAERNSMAIYNCFRGNERYITPEGLRAFNMTVGTTQTVLNGKGEWAKADIAQFGEQELVEVTMRPGWRSKTAMRHRISCTANHRWITTNRGEVTDLKVGDCVSFVAPPQAEFNLEAWISGFGFGDGTIAKAGQAKVRLSKAKARHLHHFTEYGHNSVCYPPSAEGDPVVIFHIGYFSNWKKLPKYKDAAWLSSWLEGYLAADGHWKDGEIEGLGSQSDDAIRFVIKVAPLAGYMVTGHNISSVTETNYGPRSAPLQKIYLRRSGQFKVTGIEPLGVREPVYCAIVPDGEDFVLSHGIHTGNCSFLPVRDIGAFAEAMHISLAGCGVGYSVERGNVEQFPRILRQTGVHLGTYAIEDSAAGWAESVRAGLSAWSNGADVNFDYSRIRAVGTPLKTKGGRASGSAPLKFVLDFLRTKVLSRQGTFLRTVDAHDMMCVVGGAAVSGGVRRTAMIALFDFDDLDMKTCKDGVKLDEAPWRWNANNSAVWPDEVSQIDLVDQFADMYRHRRGEPGIFSRSNANATKPARRAEHPFGTNPCVTGDTVIATLDGPRRMDDLARKGKDVLVYAWHPETRKPVVRWMRRPHLTRKKVELLEVTFDSGLTVRCTPDHSFYSFQGNKVQAQNLRVGKSVRAWSLNRHKHGHLRVHGWNREEDKADHQWVARMVWECYNGPLSLDWLVHHRDEDKENNDISNLEIMSHYEHNSHHYPARALAGFDGKCPNHKVVGIREVEPGDVYNGCVDDAHTYIIVDPDPVTGPDSRTFMTGIVSANCGEINLREYEFCNLSIAVARPTDQWADLRDKVEVATIIGTIQSLATTFPGMRPEWKKNCEEERLLGVDISGQQDCPYVQHPEVLEQLRRVAVSTNQTVAKTLGINPSAAVTCNKPNGNSSQLLDCASGIHRRWSEYYIRNVRVSPHTPIYKVLRAAGVPMDPENGQNERNATSWVVHFPVKSPDKARTRKGYSAVEQCEYWLMNKTYWTEHNPSVTITYQPEELILLMGWVWEHRDVVGGMAFLPASDAQYAQMPYETIDEETYLRLQAEFPVIDFSLLYAYERSDMSEASSEVACSSGLCEI